MEETCRRPGRDFLADCLSVPGGWGSQAPLFSHQCAKVRTHSQCACQWRVSPRSSSGPLAQQGTGEERCCFSALCPKNPIWPAPVLLIAHG